MNCKQACACCVCSFAEGHQAFLSMHRRSLRAAGCMLAAVRMLAWVALLTADQPWLTDNDTTIRGLLVNTAHDGVMMCRSAGPQFQRSTYKNTDL